MTKMFYFHRFWLPFYHALWVFCLVYMLHSVSGEVYTHHIDDQRTHLVYEVHSLSSEVARAFADMMRRRGLPIGFEYPLGSIALEWDADAASSSAAAGAGGIMAVFRVKLYRVLSHEHHASMDPFLRMVHDMFSCETPLLGDIPLEKPDGTFRSDYFSYQSFKRAMQAHFKTVLRRETHADAMGPTAHLEQTIEAPGTKRKRRSRSV